MGLFDKKERKPQDAAIPEDRLAIFLANYRGINPMYQADSAQAFERHPEMQKVQKAALDLQEPFRAQRKLAGVSPTLSWNPKMLNLIYPFQWYNEVLPDDSPESLQPLLEKIDFFFRYRYLSEATDAERSLFYGKAGPTLDNLFQSSDKMGAFPAPELSTMFIFLLTPNVRPLQLSDGSYY